MGPQEASPPPPPRLRVTVCHQVDKAAYLAPGGEKLKLHGVDALPLPTGDTVRLVCISDTHNLHADLRLPRGDVLIHAGDVLTESGLRHVRRDEATRVILEVLPDGVRLFEEFARWFGSQPFESKVLIGGNHDLVLEGLGQQDVQAILDKYTTFGQCHYLIGQETTLAGGLRVFGSPFAAYSSHNDAFFHDNPKYTVAEGVDVVVTHMPAVLPKEGAVKLQPIAQAALQAGAKLHVGGHCHWAWGLHFATRGTQCLPGVVASNSGSHWLDKSSMCSATGERLDLQDAHMGGYNTKNPCIVCDVLHCRQDPTAQAELPITTSPRPSLLLFSPPATSELRETLLKQLEALFDVHVVEDAEAGKALAGRMRVAAFVGKLGTSNNLAVSILDVLKVQEPRPFVVIHSETAANSSATQEKLSRQHRVNHFTTSGREEELLTLLSQVVLATSSDATRNLTDDTQAEGLPKKLLLFCPNDPKVVTALLLDLRNIFHEVVLVDSSQRGLEAISATTFAACIAKLGTKGNLGYDVISALRAKEGQEDPFVAIHSATAMRNDRTRARLQEDLGVNYFTEHGGESELVAHLRARFHR